MLYKRVAREQVCMLTVLLHVITILSQGDFLKLVSFCDSLLPQMLEDRHIYCSYSIFWQVVPQTYWPITSLLTSFISMFSALLITNLSNPDSWLWSEYVNSSLCAHNLQTRHNILLTHCHNSHLPQLIFSEHNMASYGIDYSYPAFFPFLSFLSCCVV